MHLSIHRHRPSSGPRSHPVYPSRSAPLIPPPPMQLLLLSPIWYLLNDDDDDDDDDNYAENNNNDNDDDDSDVRQYVDMVYINIRSPTQYSI